MRITFIQPYYENVWESLGLGYIIAYVKQYARYEDNGKEHDFRFFQGNFDRQSEMVLVGSRSDIVAISCTSPTYAHGLQIARDIKFLNPDVHIVFGGWHPTAVPHDVIQDVGVDQVIVGEGELAMCRVILGTRKPILKGVKLQPDELPWPDREAILNHRTVNLCEQMTGYRIASFQLNRGCKVHCKFCAEVGMTGKHQGKKNPIRTRDFDDLLHEIDTVAFIYKLDYFKFVDATFDRDPQTVIDFCKAKIARGMILPWEANIHPNFVQNEEVFKWLAEADCQQINVGVESGSPYILSDVGKGTTIGGIKKVFAWAKKYKIRTRAFFLLGMPGENSDDIVMTMDLIDSIKPDMVGFTILAPYPGSDYYDPKKHAGVDWTHVDEYSNDIWSTPNFSNRQLKEVQVKFKKEYKHLLCERQS